jgi:ankyrin repeat protein
MNNVTLMSKLADQGADFNLVDYRGRAPIHIACINGNEEVVKYLLEQNLDLDLIDNAG